jgi:hypothetical protein
MSNENNIKLSKELFECYRKNLLDFYDKYDAELESKEINNKDFYLILSSSLSNLTKMILGLEFGADKKK